MSVTRPLPVLVDIVLGAGPLAIIGSGTQAEAYLKTLHPVQVLLSATPFMQILLYCCWGFLIGKLVVAVDNRLPERAALPHTPK